MTKADWASLPAEQRIELITATMRRLAVDGYAPSAKEWNERRPHWMPCHSVIGNYFTVQFLTVAICAGLQPRPQNRRYGTETHCECGLPLTQYRLARIGFDAVTSAALIPLCDSCAAEWDSVEN
jgi:hypothetical protein